MSEDFYDTILRCGLYFGAVFQLICIAAVVIIPDNSSSGSGNSKVMKKFSFIILMRFHFFFKCLHNIDNNKNLIKMTFTSY